MGERVGEVKLYNKRKGFGIIQSDERDYFFRWTDIVSPTHKHCIAGEKVLFIPQMHSRGLRASQVVKMG